METFKKLPVELANFLKQTNGLIALNGGIHIRGCVSQPNWISLDEVWTGESSLYRTYDCLTETDIPFAQDPFGDQFILRDETVWRLNSEYGELENLELSFNGFLNAVINNPIEFLMLESFNQLFEMNIRLEPGQLINVYPPFMFNSNDERSFKPVSTKEQIQLLKKLYLETKDLPEGQQIEIKVEE
ncbi:MAG: SMI1/KNR4 family protein [Reichenbachiella sp.]